MKTIMLLAICCLCSKILTAQNINAYPVKVGEKPNYVIPYAVQYAFPAFKQGTAFLRNGTTSVQSFNYNCLLDEMQFVTAAGDTLAIADPVLIKNIIIDSAVYYYDKGYLEEVSSISGYKIAVKKILVQIADKTIGAYDAASGASSITTYGSINNNSQIYRLQVKKDVLFQQETYYFVSDAFNQFVKADRKNFLHLFDRKRSAIVHYIRDHAVNFNQEDDLQQLLQFCTAD